ncbi:hypothetical protein AK830_g11020 [Neonectria ditissima]|uniref:Uncharacterized protein n=1 Tax=Neonectria ditissima TaxID=78410 RepID=A0A0P7B5Y0_9HYPO|nr:hypothetical protein AK830_g11020 [Neonectria ditissima]
MPELALSDNVAGLEQTVTALQEIIDKQQVDIEQQRQKIAGLRDHLYCYECDIKSLQDSKHRFNAKFEQHARESAEYQYLLYQQKMQNEELQDTVTTTNRDRERLRGEIADAQHLIDCMRTETADLKDQLHKCHKLLGEKQAHNDVLQMACIESDNKGKLLREELAASKGAEESSQTSIAKLKSTTNELIRILHNYIHDARVHQTGLKSIYRRFPSIKEQGAFKSLIQKSERVVFRRPQLVKKVLDDALKGIGVPPREMLAPEPVFVGRKKRKAT